MAEDVQGQRHDRPGQGQPHDRPGRSGSAERSHGPGVFPGRRRLAATLAVAAAVVAIGVPVALAGKYRSDPPAAAAETSPPFIEGQPPSLPPLVQQPDASPASPIPGAVKGRPDEDGCPVDASRLMAVLRASDLYSHLAAPQELADVDCYATYALAHTEPVAADPAMVVFRYTELTESWRAVSGGTSGACDDVPRAVRAHLRRCG